jgi:hypothetical protein
MGFMFYSICWWLLIFRELPIKQPKCKDDDAERDKQENYTRGVVDLNWVEILPIAESQNGVLVVN